MKFFWIINLSSNEACDWLNLPKFAGPMDMKARAHHTAMNAYTSEGIWRKEQMMERILTYLLVQKDQNHFDHQKTGNLPREV